MEFNNKQQINPAELQANSSITLEVVNNNDPIIIQLILPRIKQWWDLKEPSVLEAGA